MNTNTVRTLLHRKPTISCLCFMLLLWLLTAMSSQAQLPAEDHLHISLSAPNTYALSVATDSLWEYRLEASDDLEIWQALDTVFLPGDGGVHSQRVIVPQGAIKAFFRYRMQERAGGASGNTLTDWDRIYSFNADTFLDTDHDGVPDIFETALGTDAYDGFSFPWQVVRVDPFDQQAGHPRDGAIVVYLNRPLPTSVVNVPANFVRRLYHTVEDVLDFANAAPGTTMILPGRKAVAFLPSPALAAGSNHTYVNNYKIDFTTSVTSIATLVPWHSEFSTVDTFDVVGSWVKMVRPGETAIEVATDFAPVIDWSQPLHPSTLVSGNVTVVEQVSGKPVAVTVAFDYDTNRMTLQHATPFLPDTAYTVTLGTGFTNLIGKPLLNAFTWSFRTRPPRPAPVAGQGPYVTAVTPGDFATAVDAVNTTQITLTFNEAMDDSTLTAATVHLHQHAASTDVGGAFAYNSATKTLTFTPDASLDFATRYELTLDFSSILSSASTPQPLQGQMEFVFTTGLDPFQSGGGSGGMGGAGSGPGGSSGTPAPDQPQPIQLQLAYGDPDMDAGASVRLTITLPNGSQREVQMPNATNEYRTEISPEIPFGSTTVVYPQFLKGNDPDYDEELSEVNVQVTALLNSSTAAYVVFKTTSPPTWSLLGALAGGAFVAEVILNERLKVAPADVVAVFGFGETGKTVTTTYLDGAATAKFGNLYAVAGKDMQGANKTYTVLLGQSEAELKQGLSIPGCVVVFDGHSNMGIGPAFGAAGINRISDFTNFGNPRTALNIALLEEEYPALAINNAEIVATETNYIVPNYESPGSKLRYPNNENIGANGVFHVMGNNPKYHLTRTGDSGNPNKWTIVKAGSADLPALQYKAYFYNSCSSGRDYIEVFNKGTLFYTTETCSVAETTQVFLKSVIEGNTLQAVLNAINGSEGVNKMITR